MATEKLNVIVTGSASGLGAASAAILAGQGARVVINYSSSQKEAEQTADTCRAAGGEVVVVQGDVSRDEDCRKIVAAAAPWGRLDALINNAGITKHVDHGDLDGLSAEDFQRIYAVNTIGPFLMMRAAAPHLIATGNGAVVNISSRAALTGTGSSIAYAASKGALNTLTLSFARQLAPNVRVNAVCPALTEQGFVERLAPESFAQRKAEQIARSPLQRIGKPEEVAESIHWLITSAAMMTGVCLELDFGLHLNG